MLENAQRYKVFLENMTPKTLTHLPEYVSYEVHFKDPFNDVIGIESMAKVFHHMFQNVEAISFKVNDLGHIGTTTLMQWEFSGTFRNKRFSIDGASKIVFGSDGYVNAHIDYWDAAQNVYERVPLLGKLLSWLRMQFSVR